MQSIPAAYLPTANVGPGITISQIVTNPDGSISETVSFAGSGLVFNNTLGAGVSQAYLNCILAAEQEIAGNWTNSCTINESFVGQALGTTGTLASNSFYVYGVSYATLKNALTTLASQEPSNSILQQAVAHLPSSDPSGGQGFKLALPYARILGLTSSSLNPEDFVTLNTSYNWNYGQDVINTLEHEITEGGMGRIGGLGDQNSLWSVMDLFRYNSSGVLDVTDGRDGRTTYFSYDGGATLSKSLVQQRVQRVHQNQRWRHGRFQSTGRIWHRQSGRKQRSLTDRLPSDGGDGLVAARHLDGD